MSLDCSTSVGGEYICPLFGVCVAPAPQGPFEVKSGSSVGIPFKNVFTKPVEFSLMTDNPAFSCKSTEVIAPGKTINLSIGYKSSTSNSSSGKSSSKKDVKGETGKLIVSCKELEDSNPGTKWIFYLQSYK